MTDHSIWKENFKITHFFVNPDGLASMHGLAFCLQETAVNHATARNLGYEDLIRENKAWVLTRQLIKLHKIPVISQIIIVESWVDETTDAFSVRDFHILDKQENILGLARTSWMMMDLGTRRPVPIPKDIREKMPHAPGRICENIPLEKILTSGQIPQDKSLYKVVYSDLDMNNHVNNIHYLKWVMDDFKLDFRQNFLIESIETNYLSEAMYGDELLKNTTRDPNDQNIYITEIINRRTDRLILCSRTKWLKKE